MPQIEPKRVEAKYTENVMALISDNDQTFIRAVAEFQNGDPVAALWQSLF
jgi:hypothetical protein